MLTPVDISTGQVSGVDSLSSATSSVINFETDESGINVPRPGLATYTVSNLGTDKCIGLIHWKDYVIAATSDGSTTRKIWAINDQVPTYADALSDSTSATQLEGAEQRATFALGDTYVYLAAGGRIQRWKSDLTYTEVMSSSPRCTHIASMANYLIANDIGSPSSLKWSDIGEGSWATWSAGNNTTVDARPDPVVGLFENANELFVFGSETLQVYALGADPTLPFETVSTINTGLGAPYAACRLDENFAFFDDKRRVVISDGRTVKPISDAIQKDLRGLSEVEDAWMYREERGQMSLIVVRFPTAKRTFAYDLKAEKWQNERRYYSAGSNEADWPTGAHVYWPATNYDLFGSTLAAGGLLRLDADSRQDIGGVMVCERITGWTDFGNSATRKRSSKTMLVLRRGTAAQGATPGAYEIRKQDDDGPWSQWTQVSIGTPSQYEHTVRVFATNGIFRRRRYHIRFSTTEQASVVALYDDVEDLDAQVAA